jgi:hypothetical protein
MSEATTAQLQQLSESIFGGYKIGVELLIVNAAITFLLLFLTSRKATGKEAAVAASLQTA